MASGQNTCAGGSVWPYGCGRNELTPLQRLTLCGAMASGQNTRERECVGRTDILAMCGASHAGAMNLRPYMADALRCDVCGWRECSGLRSKASGWVVLG
jgi:hypothetical protein